MEGAGDLGFALAAGVDPAYIAWALAQSPYDVVMVTDDSFNIQYISDSNLTMFGRTADEAIGANALSYIHPDDLQMLAVIMNAHDSGYRSRGLNYYRVRHEDGSWVEIEASGMRLTVGDEYVGWISIIRRPLNSEIYADVVQGLYEELPLAIVLNDVPAMMISRSPGSTCMSLWPSSEPPFTVGDRMPPSLTGIVQAPGSPFERAARGEVVTIDDLAELHDATRADAEREGFDSAILVPVREPNGRVAGMIVMWSHADHPSPPALRSIIDKTAGLVEVALATRWQHTDLKRSASVDLVTGLANRRAFEQAMRSAERDSSVLLAIDLDGFKAVNDRFGHPAGDELLRIIANRLAAVVGVDDLAARVGGDEFMVLATSSLDDATVIGQRIVDSVREPIDLDGVEVRVGASVGIASLRGEPWVDVPASGDATEAWLADVQRRADAALYEAKRSGRGRFIVVHEPADK